MTHGNNGHETGRTNTKILTLKKAAAFILIILVIAAAGMVAGISYFNHFITAPGNSTGFWGQRQTREAVDVLFTIEPGESLKATAKRLEEEGLVTNGYLFRLMAVARGRAKKIQAGEYLLSTSLSPENILDYMVRGRVKLYRFTIPEGLTIKDIAQVVENAGFGKKERFIELAGNSSFIQDLNLQEIMDGIAPPINSLEGYLFPDTYSFGGHAEPGEIIAVMVKRFKQIFIPLWRERHPDHELSPHETVTLASIIEKETGAAHERPLISSVFHNRRHRKMRLQSDPTVIYGIPDFSGSITRSQLKEPTPYNTYTIAGLPPGPIANPGKESIKAALFPEKSGYLYFVSKNDGTHVFSNSLKDHNRAVRQYQR
ncbi:MAG: endolytic transglycosylase MltG [Desulfamplus sp.]|nr:endolytic transglycosylase MltG [Desulfamplus sp.]